MQGNLDNTKVIHSLGVTLKKYTMKSTNWRVKNSTTKVYKHKISKVSKIRFGEVEHNVHWLNNIETIQHNKIVLNP